MNKDCQIREISQQRAHTTLLARHQALIHTNAELSKEREDFIARESQARIAVAERNACRDRSRKMEAERDSFAKELALWKGRAEASSQEAEAFRKKFASQEETVAARDATIAELRAQLANRETGMGVTLHVPIQGSIVAQHLVTRDDGHVMECYTGHPNVACHHYGIKVVNGDIRVHPWCIHTRPLPSPTGQEPPAKRPCPN